MSDNQGQPETDWSQRFPEWSDVGENYNIGVPKQSWREIIGLGTAANNEPVLPQDEIEYCQRNGIKFENVKLGSGSFGTVWLASYNGKQVACKIIHLKSFAPSGGWLEKPITVKEAVEKLIAEGEFHQKLKHRNIVRCVNLFNIPDPKTAFPHIRLLLFMELCEGTLWSLINNKVLTESEAKDMLRDVTAGLKYIHDQNICHLDLKPDNIMYIKEQGDKLCYKLTDFGLSKRFDPLSGPDTEMAPRTGGAPLFRAPELFYASTFNPPLADVYSLGYTLAYCLLGSWASFLTITWHSSTPDQQFAVKYGLSLSMVRLIRRMTTRDPLKRISLSQVIDFLNDESTLQSEDTTDWSQRFIDWKDIGEQYKIDVPLPSSWSGRNGAALPPEEIKYCEDNGIKFEDTKLGSGSFSTIWLVSYNDNRLACKVMSLKTFAPRSGWLFKDKPKTVKEAVEQLLSETDIHQNLLHRNVVKCEHIFNIPDLKTCFPYVRLLLFMELCDGTLMQVIQSKPNNKLTETEAMDLLRDVTTGLKYMHDQNICHLNIDPDNILYVTEQGNKLCYKLSDFGHSKRFDPLSDSVDTKGPGGDYMAPELLSEGPVNLPLADVYSLGYILAFSLIGSSGISPLLGRLIRQMINKDPKNRISLNEVAHFILNS